jgi:sugar transferase EpsL
MDVTKRLLDLALSLLLLVPTLLIIVVVGIVTVACNGRPVFFSQERIGLRGKTFRLFKIRSMSNAVGPDGQLLPDEFRMTRWGNLLRAWSLDELPQLWSVLRGDMSLVGPRPLPTRYAPRFSERQFRRHLVRPGITGWAQINGRNALSWNQKFELDIWYVENRGIRVDLKILWLTLVRVLRREGISSEGHVTMPEFQGEHE